MKDQVKCSDGYLEDASANPLTDVEPTVEITDNCKRKQLIRKIKKK